MSEILSKLSRKIEGRKTFDPNTSYTAALLNSSDDKSAEKFGEEAIELIISATKEDKEKIKQEAADVLYHFLVLLVDKKVNFGDVLEVLETRTSTSGLEEKKARLK